MNFHSKKTQRIISTVIALILIISLVLPYIISLLG